MADYYEDYIFCMQYRTPQRAVSTLRKVYRSKNWARRASYTSGFIIYDHEDYESDILINFGMPELLMEILLDDDTYQFIEPSRTRETEEYINVDAIVSATTVVYIDKDGSI